MDVAIQQVMPEPPVVGLLVGAIGRTLVFVSVLAFVLSAVSALFDKSRCSRRSLGVVCFWVGVASTVAVFTAHIALILSARFEFAYVFENSENSMPFLFRLSAAWAAQEGSFLLWTLMSSLTGAVLIRSTGPYKRLFLASFGCVMALKFGILAFESPFRLLDISPGELQAMFGATSSAVPVDGLGMNPVLQNYWMVIHPLLIFAGFGALTPLYCLTVAAAVSKDWQSWIALARPFVIFTMTVLGLGLILGGLWAYETLGWGGFWAWDPVENAALVPWIAIVVLMHGLLIQANRGRWVRLNFLLGALPFCWFVYGTFLTRSGVLADVSVHSFSQMNEGAHGVLLWMIRVILLSLLFGTGYVLSRKISTKSDQPITLQGHGRVLLLLSGAIVVLSVLTLAFIDGLDTVPVVRVSSVVVLCWLAMFAGVKIGHKADSAIAEVRTDSPGHRTVWMGAGVAVLYVIGVATAIGMSIPFLANIFGEQAWVVTEESYNRDLVVPFIIVMAMIGIAPFLGWTKTAGGRIKRLILVLIVSFVLTVAPVIVLFSSGKLSSVLIGLPIWLCVFAVVANMTRVFERTRARSGGSGAFLVHSGLALLLIGLIVSRVLGDEQATSVSLSKNGNLFGYSVSLVSDPDTQALLQKDNIVSFELSQGTTSHTFEPVLYYDEDVNGEYHPVTKPAILRFVRHDLYFSLTSRLPTYKTNVGIDPGETQEIDRFTVRYLESRRSEDGTRLSVVLEITDGDETTIVEPSFKIEDDAAEEFHATVNDELKVALHALDATSDRALLSLLPPHQIFTVQLFYRPLTVLVWIGTLLITLGGILAATRIGRRARDKARAH